MIDRSAFRDKIEQFKEGRTNKFDESVTLSLIKVLKLPARIKRSIYEIANSYSRSHPILEDLREALPDLPFYPVADEQPNLRDNAGLSQIFPAKRFAKQPFVKRYLELHELTTGEREEIPLVLIYKWPFVSDGVCLHTIPVDEEVPGIRLVYTTGEHEDVSFTFVIEPLKQLGLLLEQNGWEYT